MREIIRAFTHLKEKFWEPHLPYAVTDVQKSIEDTKNIAEPEMRLSEIIQILKDAIASKGEQAAKSDLYQGLKLLSYHGALPYDSKIEGAPCVVQAMMYRGQFSEEMTAMVSALCAAQNDEVVSLAVQKKWAEKTYAVRYTGFISDESDKNHGLDIDEKKCVLLQGPAHWFCRRHD